MTLNAGRTATDRPSAQLAGDRVDYEQVGAKWRPAGRRSGRDGVCVHATCAGGRAGGTLRIIAADSTSSGPCSRIGTRLLWFEALRKSQIPNPKSQIPN